MLRLAGGGELDPNGAGVAAGGGHDPDQPGGLGIVENGLDRGWPGREAAASPGRSRARSGGNALVASVSSTTQRSDVVSCSASTTPRTAEVARWAWTMSWLLRMTVSSMGPMVGVRRCRVVARGAASRVHV